MKKTFTLLCACFFCIAMVAQQTHKMQIKLKTGETVEYMTSDVDNITFEEEQPDPGTFSVNFKLDELTSSSFTLTITPTSNTKYYASVWTKEFMTNEDGSWLADNQLIETCIPDPDYDSKCYTGTCVLNGSNYLPGAELAVIVFDAEARDGKNVEVFKYGIKLNEGLSQEDQFTLSDQEVGFTDVKFHATANDPNGFIMARVLEKSYFDKHGETVMQNLYFMINNAAVEKLMDISDYVRQNGAYGECDFYFDNLKSNTEYVAAVFYVDPTNEDPTKVYDWNFTRWDFTTKEATNLPTLEISNVKKTKNSDGTINITLNAKSSNAAKAYCAPKLASDVEKYLDEDPETWSDLYISFSPLYSSQLERMNSPEGCDLEFNGIDDGDYYILMRVKNTEGGTKTVVTKVEE